MPIRSAKSALTVLASAASAGLLACSSAAQGNGSTASSPPASSSSSLTDSAAASSSPASSEASTSPSDTVSASSSSESEPISSAHSAPPNPPPSTPHSDPAVSVAITSFTIVQQPTCPVVATADAPFAKPGMDVKLQWSASGTSMVALSLDNPNFYASNHSGSFGSYPAHNEVDLSFECDPTAGPNTTHSYTLNTVTTPSVQRTITITVPTNP